MSVAFAHPNGFVPLSEVTGALPWNAAICGCGALRDARAAQCRACFLAPKATKLCPGCDLVLPAEAFYRRKNGDFIPRCKTCTAKAGKARSTAAYCAATRARPGHYQAVAERIARRCETDPEFKLAYNLRRALRQALTRYGGEKSQATVAYLGCSVAEFRAYIERQWSPGMTWANWGRRRDRWHIDHKRPIASFDLTQEADRAACFHFSNMQPLWALDNIAKGDSWAPPL